MNTIVTVRDSIAINKPIVTEYVTQAHRNGIPADLLQRALEGQTFLGSIQIVKVSGDLRRWAVEGISNQDQRFVVAARASHAEYLISQDPGIQSQRQQLAGPPVRVQVVFPHEYIDIKHRA